MEVYVVLRMQTYRSAVLYIAGVRHEEQAAKDLAEELRKLGSTEDVRIEKHEVK
jgi:translation initiation factor 1 (eIF-1/SUI1)